MPPAKTRSVRDELAELRDVLAVRLRGPDELEVEYRRALADRETARQQQVTFFAAVPPGVDADPDKERAMRERVHATEEQANSPWDARREGTRLAIEQARTAVAVFVRDHLGDLAAELLPLSVAAQVRLAGALDETERALEQFSDVSREWQQVMPLAGLPISELPTLDVAAVQQALPAEVPVPAPLSLLEPAPTNPLED